MNYSDVKNGFKISVHSRIRVPSHDFQCLMKKLHTNRKMMTKVKVIGVPSNLQDIPSLADIDHIILGIFVSSKISFESFSSVERSNIFNHFRKLQMRTKSYTDMDHANV